MFIVDVISHNLLLPVPCEWTDLLILIEQLMHKRNKMILMHYNCNSYILQLFQYDVTGNITCHIFSLK